MTGTAAFDPNRNIALMLSCEHQAPQLVGPRLLFDHLVCEREQLWRDF
jgi:hypothetical protein